MISFRTQNVQQGLHSSGSKGRAAWLDKTGTVKSWLDAGTTVVAVQEAGVRSDTTPPPIRDGLFPHTSLFTNDTTTRSGVQSVGLVVHESWRVDHVKRLPASSRLIGAEIRRKGTVALVVSVLLPPGLDFCPPKPPSPADSDEVRVRKTNLAEARLILDTVQMWAAPYDLVIVLGDMNCTIVPGFDRGSAGCPAVNPLTESILAPPSPFIDVYRSVHPRLEGWTRLRARLDYILVKLPGEHVRVQSCDTDWGFPSDHAGLECSLDIDPGTALTCRKPAPRAFDLRRASDEQRDHFRREGNAAAKLVVDRLRADRASAGGDNEALLRILEDAQKEASSPLPSPVSPPQKSGLTIRGSRPSDFGFMPFVAWYGPSRSRGMASSRPSPGAGLSTRPGRSWLTLALR